MKTSMNLYFNSNIDTKTKLDTIKELGFDEFFTGIYDKKETMSFEEQMEYAKKIGLKCTMVHCAYYEPKLNSFWLEGQDGDDIADDLINQIGRCGKYTKNFVVHLNGSKESTVSKIGLERIKRILKACENHNLNFCVENLYSDKEIPYIFENISHPLLKICYDSGHRNFLTPNFDICERYGKYITVLHLHENNGLQDEHKKLSVGSPVFNKLKKEINMMNDDVVLASEARGVCENWKEYINSDLKTLKELGKYKKSEMILENWCAMRWNGRN